MSDIQRWDIDLSNGDPFKSENGDWIEYADYVAAVAAARIKDDEYQKDMLAENDAGYAQGLHDARDAVAAMRPETDPDIAHVIVSDAIAAIDAKLKEKP